MLKFNEFMNVIGYKVTEGGSHYLDCFGPDSYVFERWNGIAGERGWSTSMVFDLRTRLVYEVEVSDHANGTTYRMLAPGYRERYLAEKRNKNYVDDHFVYELDDSEEMLYHMHRVIDEHAADEFFKVKVSCRAEGKVHDF